MSESSQNLQGASYCAPEVYAFPLLSSNLNADCNTSLPGEDLKLYATAALHTSLETFTLLHPQLWTLTLEAKPIWQYARVAMVGGHLCIENKPAYESELKAILLFIQGTWILKYT